MRSKTRVKPSQRSARRVTAREPFFPRAQAKLTVGPKGDRFEVEADRVADRVVLNPGAAGPVADRVTPGAQRAPEDEQPRTATAETARTPADEEARLAVDEEARTRDEEQIQSRDDGETQAQDEEQTQAQDQEESQAQDKEESQARGEEESQAHEEEEEQTQAQDEEQTQDEEEGAQPAELQRRAAPGAPRAAPPDADGLLRRVRGTGEALPDPVRRRMGRAFGADFGGVRVHRSGMAERLSRLLGARAFALGRDLFFGRDEFRPGTRRGDHLLAHELTHTIQQGAVEQCGTRPDSGPRPAGSSRPAVTGPVGVGAAGRPTDDVAERPADAKPSPQATEPQQAAAGAADSPVPSEVKVTVPPAPATPDTVADAVEPVALEGSSSEAFAGFTRASASQMAATQPKLGDALQQKEAGERKAEADSAPVLTATLSGQDVPLVKPQDVPPASAEVGDGRVGPDAPPLTPEPQTNRGAPPNNTAAADAIPTNADDAEVIQRAQDAMRRLTTNDPNVDTSAGPPPKVDTSGDADPVRTARQQQEASKQARAQRDGAAKTLREHPGQSNVQPKKLEEPKAVKLTAEASETIETKAEASSQDYTAAPLTADVRAKADEMLAPTLGANLNESRTKATEAAAARDRDRTAKVDEAERRTRKINEEADRDQRAEVTKQRTAIAGQQKQGIDEANAYITTFEKDAGRERTSTDDAVRSKTAQAEKDSRAELDKGEQKAESERKRGEAEAAREKAKAEKEQKNQSWWDRAKSAIKSAVKALTGLIDKIFTAVRNAVKKLIEAARDLAVGIINAARKWVVDKLNKFRDWAKKAVNALLKDTFPGLARRINKAIDAVVDTAIAGVNKIADAAVAAVNAIANGLAAALDKVLSTFQTALKAAVRVAGAVLTGDLAGALRIAIEAACSIAGVDPQPVFDFMDRAAANLMRILRHPVDFFNNLVSAVGRGVRNFLGNIKQHLIQGVIGWLTGALSDTPITLPEKFDFRGIVSLALQILGLTYDNIKARVIRKYPQAERVFGVLEKSVEIIRGVLTEGPVFLWRWIKQSLSDLKEKVIGGIRNMLITTVIEQGVVWVLSLLNPAGAIARVVKLLFDVVRFLIERFQQIKDFVLSVYNAVSEIAAGKLEPAAKAVEGALARSLPVVIGFMASVLGLGGLGSKVKKLIGTITKPINKVLDKIIDTVVEAAKKLFKKGKAAAKTVKEKVANWWKKRKSFTTKSGESHSVQFRGQGKSAELTIKSKETPIDKFLRTIGAEDTPERKKKRGTAIKHHDKVRKGVLKNDQAVIDREFPGLVSAMRALLDDDTTPETKPPKWSGVNTQGYGKRMEVKGLTRIGLTAGSTPDKSPHPAYDVINQRKEGKREFYVRGHLLSQWLGGPGQWHNMTPLKQSANHDHESRVESKLKSLVGRGEIIDYTVVPVHGGQSVGSVVKLKAEHPGHEDLIERLVAHEKDVPRALSITAKHRKSTADKCKDVFGGKVTIPNAVGSDPYEFTWTTRPTPIAIGSDISAHYDTLSNRLGASNADLLQKALEKRSRSFASYQDLKEALYLAKTGKTDGSPGAFGAEVNSWKDEGFIKLR